MHETVLTARISDVEQPIGNWKKLSNYTTYIGEDKKQAWREYPLPCNIDQLMSLWLENLNASLSKNYTRQEVIEVYADLHVSLVSIHPFFDGNGRMARLLANLPVLKSGFPPIVVPEADRYRYQLVLSNYQNTILDLANLSDLKPLQNNAKKQVFVDLCYDYWNETLDLVNKANAIQEKRRRDAK